MEKFDILNELEATLLAARSGEIPISKLMEKFVSSDLFLPTVHEVKEDGSGFEPVLFDKNGTKMLSVFTDKSRTVKLADVANYCLMMNGLSVLRRIPRGYGVVVNPGLAVGFELSPEGITEVLLDMQ